MPEDREFVSRFEQDVLPHLGAAFNLARWILGNEQDAEDMVQEAYLRAYKYFAGYQGGSSRSWLLAIVRNACYTWLQQNKAQLQADDLDEEFYSGEGDMLDPEVILQLSNQKDLVHRAIELIPTEFRELIILREMEGLSYKEIALVTSLPIGTVMSRLARGRQYLKDNLLRLGEEDHSHGS